MTEDPDVEDEPDDLLAAVRMYALRRASGDRILRARPDVSADDVAQDIALQFHRLAEKPTHWKGWVATAVRHRLIDLALQRRPAVYLETELQDQIESTMGPSAGVIALQQAREALSVLSPRERDLFGEHLLGLSNAELAERFGYASPAVVGTLIHRIGGKIREAFPDLHLDLEPQRVYPPGPRLERRRP